MTMSFITSKRGKIESLEIYKFKFSDSLLKQDNQLNKFIKWIRCNDNILLFNINNVGFSTFNKIEISDTWQFSFMEKITLKPPFDNLQEISSYLGSIFRKNISQFYLRFQNLNEFIIEEIDVNEFKIYKNIEFNIDFFSDGHFYLHFSTISKIVSSNNIDIAFLNSLRNKLIRKDQKDISINLIEQQNFKRKKICLVREDIENEAKSYIENHKNVIASFDYKFLSSFLERDFQYIANELSKEIEATIAFVEKVIRSIDFCPLFDFQEKPFYKIENVIQIGTICNLTVGNNQNVFKQSAAYHNGVYKTLDNCLLVPVYMDRYDEVVNFSELFSLFNKNANNFEIGTALRINSSDNSCFNVLKNIQEQEQNRKVLFAIFVEYEMTNDVIKELRRSKVQFQLCLGGNKDTFELSNFIVKCIEMHGGLLSIIKDLGETEGTYFIGIDLGHAHIEGKRFSNMALSFFDEKGIYIHNGIERNLILNEALDPIAFSNILRGFKKYLYKMKKTYPIRFVVHRDGKNHKNDTHIINESILAIFNLSDVDIIEIIKQGQPIFAGYNTKYRKFHNLDSGDFYMDEKHKYALLMTNTQADKKNELVNPITIKVQQSIKPLDHIVNQVYWFTKIYTNNLYNSSKLPATTQKANNIVGTSNTIHISTFKG